MNSLTSKELRARRLISLPTLFLGRILYYKKRAAPSIIQRVLFFKFGALGDVLMTTPLVAAVRQHYPTAQLSYATGSWSAPALANNPHLNRLVTFADSKSFWRRLAALGRTLWQLRWEQPDVVFVLDRAWQAGVLAALLGSHRIGFDRLGEGFALHHTVPYGTEPHKQAPHDIDTYLALGRFIGCSSTDRRMVLIPTLNDQAWAATQLGGGTSFVALCPGGARNPYQPMPARRWPVEYFIALGKKLAADGNAIVLLGSGADEEEARHVADQLAPFMQKNTPLINLAEQTTLPQAAAVLARCRSVVVADTGLLHVASAVGTPTVALFGPSNPRRKAPLGPHHYTIWNKTPCPRCGELMCHWERIAPHPETSVRMRLIFPEDVYAALLSLRARTSQVRQLQRVANLAQPAFHA